MLVHTHNNGTDPFDDPFDNPLCAENLVHPVNPVKKSVRIVPRQTAEKIPEGGHDGEAVSELRFQKKRSLYLRYDAF